MHVRWADRSGGCFWRAWSSPKAASGFLWPKLGGLLGFWLGRFANFCRVDLILPLHQVGHSASLGFHGAHVVVVAQIFGKHVKDLWDIFFKDFWPSAFVT